MMFLISAATTKTKCVKLINYKQRGKKTKTNKKNKPRMHILCIPKKGFLIVRKTYNIDRLASSQRPPECPGDSSQVSQFTMTPRVPWRQQSGYPESWSFGLFSCKFLNAKIHGLTLFSFNSQANLTSYHNTNQTCFLFTQALSTPMCNKIKLHQAE